MSLAIGVIVGICGLAVLAGGAWYVHHLFEGERYVRDRLRERRLAGASLAEWDARWALVEDKADVVVSLTTIPSRIGVIDHALKGLLDQSRPPRKIVLNVPYRSLREDCAYEVPEHLEGLRGIEIRRCEDMGPATKAIPTLLAEEADQVVMVVDDDRIYPRDAVEGIEKAAAALPDCAVCYAGWTVPETLVDAPTTIRSNLFMLPPAPLRGTRLRVPRETDVLLGVFGYALRPRFFDLAVLADFSDIPRACFFADDVRTSALCKAPKMVVPTRGLSFIPRKDWGQLQDTALGHINAGDGSLENRSNTIAIRHYAERWRVGGPSLAKARETR
ncbi:hypothetical protein [Shimia aestuarii]|uniref:hypothetical protein n=1 Tax=Shimia aestuarii TaxID=254406 RepID=UPI001FB34FE4|nr:hypothetical protein [Shimia aestuarii]